MSRQVNPSVVGGFVIGGIALALIGVVSFGGGSFLRQKHTFVLYFQGSLQGLQEGASVQFRGVKVGIVSELIVRYDGQSQNISTPVYIELQNRIELIGAKDSMEQTIQKMIDRGLRAHLTLQSLITGQLVVLLDMEPGTKIRLVGAEPRYPEIPTVQSPIDLFTSAIENLPIEDLVNKLLSVAKGIDDFIRSDELHAAIRNLNDTLEQTKKFVAHLDDKLDPVTDALTATARETQATLKQTRESIARLEDRIDAALRDVQSLAKRLDSESGPVAENVNKTLVELRETVAQAKATLAAIERATTEDSPLQSKLDVALDEFARTARSIRALSDYLERHPEALIQGKAGE